MGNNQPRYKVLVHRKTGTTEHPLREGGEIVLGRDPDCTVSLADTRVSRRHAIVRLRNDGVLEFSDLGSRNGSIVDGEKIAPNVFLSVGPTSVIRVGDAVLVFERAQERSAEQWCFDLATFEKRASSLLSSSKAKKNPVGLLEIRWASAAADTNRTTSTTTNSTTPPQLHQLLGRIVGADGLVGAHEGHRVVLLLPRIDAEKLAASAGLVKSICEEQKLDAEVRTAQTAEAQSVHSLLSQSAKGTGALVPPVIFHGGFYSVDTLLTRLDASDAPVLIVGETGVGKDVLAHMLHARSRRSGRPFVALNCAAFTEALFESELFGHERGAFTGAAVAKTGLLESAVGGTVFLDEIGEMPLGLQAKLLRVVENREVLRVGALQTKQIDVRFIFATNRDLRHEIEMKTFRSDLFFRIGSITLKIPPLRERTNEIVPLALHFIDVGAKRIGRSVPRLLPESQRFLEGHAWPGNVRELKNVVDLAVLVHDGDAIQPADIHIDRYIAADATSSPPTSTSAGEAAAAPVSERILVKTEHSATVQANPAGSGVPRDPNAAPMTEREAMLDALERSVWNQSAAAKLLGMSRRTFVKRLAQYELPRPRKRES